MEKIKKSKKIILMIFAVVLLLLFILCDYVFIIRKTKVLAPNEKSTNFDTKDSQTAKGAYDYYNQGLSDIGEKKYDSAISNFDKAIKLNPKEVDFYSKKAEAEVSSNKKDQAIETVKAGLAANPNNVLLQNKLDILQTIVK